MKLTRYDLSGKKYTYEGDPIDIHPYDMAVLLDDTKELTDLTTIDTQVVSLNGKLYNQTVEVPAVTTRYV